VTPPSMLWDVGRQSDDETPKVSTSVVDPLHFGTDPDPWIHTTDLRIRILLFLSVADMMPIKFFCFLLFEGTFTSVVKDKMSKRSHKILVVEIKVFLTFFAY
jgi:hypothetical protein